MANVHFVGSVALDTPEEVFAAIGQHCGPYLKRIPDGEPGGRRLWISFQIPVLRANPSLVQVGEGQIPLKLADGVQPEHIHFGELGYAREARPSYQDFVAARTGGQIPAGVRFQVSLPTPWAVVMPFCQQPDAQQIYPAYERALLREVDRITKAIPHHDLAIQWDVCVEMLAWDGRWSNARSFPGMEQVFAANFARLSAAVPSDVELGFHLCYGDLDGKHFVEPIDASKMVEMANLIARSAGRPINWIHMPVPIDRTDAPFYAPLKNLQLGADTELYLGLVHAKDGVEGTKKRIAAAREHVPSFGIASECGISRGRDPNLALDFIKTYAEAARLLVAIVLLALVLVPLRVSGQSQAAMGYEGPLIFDTYTPGPCSPNGQAHGACPQGTLHRIRVVPLATGLMNPWHIAFLPDGRSMLVSESTGRLRLIRDGSLVPEPISGWPIESLGSRVLNSVLVHPQFSQNRLVYFYYAKTGKDGMTTMALSRGRLDDVTPSEVREVFVAAAWIKGGPIAGRAAFGPDGTIYLSVNDHDEFNAIENTSVRILAQDLGNDVGKVLRVRDDGGIPPDNPFVGRTGARPEIFTIGHRNVTGFAWHPETGQLWATEIGPMGGDELNILLPGRNYGWPHVSLGRLYMDASVSEQSWFRPGMEMPVMYWMPAISPSGLAFYTGDRFPWWKGHLFLGGLNGQMLQRIAFNQPMPQTQRRESLLTQLDIRVRHVVQGTDGLLYLAVERRTGGASQPSPDPTGAVLRIEPVE